MRYSPFGERMISAMRFVRVGRLGLPLLLGCASGEDSRLTDEAGIRAEVARMADDFLNRRLLTGFVHELPLAEAYRWQDEVVERLRPAMGEVVGFKTGGHDPGPKNPNFPPDGIRAQLLSGMFREDGASIRVEDTAAGFLEADFAFRVGDDSINDAETDLELLAGLDAVVPFAEIPDPYYDPGTASVERMIVSNMISRWAFAGEPVPLEATEEWLARLRSFDFAVLDEEGGVVQRGSMSEWYDPIAAVRWLRNQLRESGKRLLPGHLLSLGNLGIIRQIHEGSPRGPAYPSRRFRLEYYGLREEGPATVTIHIER